MADQPSSGILESLPSRPLTMSEGDSIANRDYDEIKFAPLSIMLHQGDRVVTVLWLVNQRSEMTHLVGYNPDAEGWEK